MSTDDKTRYKQQETDLTLVKGVSKWPWRGRSFARYLTRIVRRGFDTIPRLHCQTINSFNSYGGDERPGLFGIQRGKRNPAHGMQYILKLRTPLMKGGKHQ